MTVLSVSVFGPELVSYERSRRIFRTNLRHFSARVFFVKTPRSQYSMIYTIFKFFKIHIPKIDSFPMLCSHPTRLPVRPSWITGYQNDWISRFTGHQNGGFSVFPGSQVTRIVVLQYSQGHSQDHRFSN